ncbi:DgyrCDS11580 [Dimorphilus gyrociliatus]|uniref:DgyrCDS11580 n=1 Tax=Dimorphilus gyrociliatus TaxID=2664684 RepID=A0A7I8W3T0_9ANNE|nr:DgyrCDS11580 [Dimorphilus gyrociliatus]
MELLLEVSLADQCKAVDLSLSLRREGFLYVLDKVFIKLKAIKEILDVKERDLDKANKIISKSKKSKEVELLIQENNILQKKLGSQEDDFRLQNETIMKELNYYITQHEELEQSMNRLKTDDNTVSTTKITENGSKELEQEVLRLNAEKTALQKNLDNIESEHDDEVRQLKSNIIELEAECIKLSGKRARPIGGVDGERSIDGDSDKETTDEADSSILNQSSLMADNSTYLKQIKSLNLSLDTEKEEKRLLANQLSELEKKYNEETEKLQNEKESLREKLRKKQESLAQIGEEKEKIYSELTTRVEELNKKLLNNHEEIQAEREKWKTTDSEIIELRINADNYLAKNKSLQAENDTLHEKLKELLIKVEEEEKQALEFKKLAEKRKSLLEEVVQKQQTEADSHRNTLKEMNESQAKLEEEYKLKIDELKISLSDVQKVAKNCSKFENLVSSLEEAKGWLERRLEDTEKEFNQFKETTEKSFQELEEKHSKELKDMKDEHTEEFEQSMELVELHKAKNNEFEEKIQQLQQNISDSIDERRLHEKKGMTVVKDLKRQLQSEKKRTEKLQERLQEVLSKYDVPVDLTTERDREGSVCSASISQMSQISPDNYEEENTELMKRLAKSMEEKDTLLERVQYLESNNSAMAEDLLRKQSLIDHFNMHKQFGQQQSQNEASSLLRKVVDLVKDEGSGSREINKKLQLMLEETLMKNVHLQENLETLSREVVRLSKPIEEIQN